MKKGNEMEKHKDVLNELKDIFLEARDLAERKKIYPDQYLLGLTLEMIDIGIMTKANKEGLLHFLKETWDDRKKERNAIRTSSKN